MDRRLIGAAYCLACGTDGPILRVSDTVGQPPPMGTAGAFEFTCGGCQRRWSWRVAFGPNGWTYDEPRERPQH